MTAQGNGEFAKRLSTFAIAALEKAGMRGIMLGGWAGLTAQMLDTSSEEEGRRLGWAHMHMHAHAHAHVHVHIHIHGAGSCTCACAYICMGQVRKGGG